jgi:hypothetical protein
MIATETETNFPNVVSRTEWLKARLELLEKEKTLTRTRDQINTARRELPMVRVDENYVFDSTDGPKSLSDLFEGRLQLVVYHFMWHWENGQALDDPCPGLLGLGRRDNAWSLQRFTLTQYHLSAHFAGSTRDDLGFQEANGLDHTLVLFLWELVQLRFSR